VAASPEERWRGDRACGKDALAKLNGQKIHLMISDVNIPNMDGITLVKEVKKAGQLQVHPIMLTTSPRRPRRKARRPGLRPGWSKLSRRRCWPVQINPALTGASEALCLSARK
jgi:CheY-like chemotaxis protein